MSSKDRPQLNVRTLQKTLKPFAKTSIFVAYSGGVDSSVLLHLCAKLRDLGSIDKLEAIHVHHGLQRQADDWVAHCQQFCSQLNVKLHVYKACISVQGSSLEQRAREARYVFFSQHLYNYSVLLQGHHRQDQAETLLFRVLRGTGIKGLCSIPWQRKLANGVILRPLLTFSRHQIEQYAKASQLSWVEDSSNFDIGFDRNFLRNKILPMLRQRWPAADKQLAELAEQANEAQELLQEIAQSLLAQASKAGEGMLIGLLGLDLNFLKKLSKAKQRLLVRAWFNQLNFPEPGGKSLNQLLEDMIYARADANPCFVLGRLSLHRWKDCLYLIDDRQVPQPTRTKVLSDHQQLLGNGSLSFQLCNQGLNLNLTDLTLLHVDYRNLEADSKKWRACNRQGSKTLKRWFQDLQIPSWLRYQVPLLYQDDELIAIAGVWVASGWQSPKGQLGYKVSWHTPWQEGFRTGLVGKI